MHVYLACGTLGLLVTKYDCTDPVGTVNMSESRDEILQLIYIIFSVILMLDCRFFFDILCSCLYRNTPQTTSRKPIMVHLRDTPHSSNALSLTNRSKRK